MKQCSKCKQWKDESEFNFRNDRSIYRSQCKLCLKGYYQNNKKRIIERLIRYCQKNKNKIAKYQREYKQTHKKERNERRQKRRNNNPKLKINNNISTLIRRSLKNGKNGQHWESILNYTVEDLMNRLEKTLPQGMTWQDFLDGKLHIDHIIPVSVFNFDSYNDLDFHRCFALENLQFLKVKDNLKKHNKINKPFQPSLKI